MKHEHNPNSNLVMLRAEFEITQKQLADALGVTEQTIRNWEQGKAIPRLTISQMKVLCRVFRRSIEEMPDSFGSENKKAEA
jgi:DNA-binding XRE family transcriptional regulator